LWTVQFVSSTASVGSAENQIEDNTTKALVNLLEYGGHALTASFVSEFVGVADPSGPWEYMLQRGPKTPAAPDRFLLGLSADGKLAPAPANDGNEFGSRVDGALYIAGNVLIALESKVGDAELDGRQFSAHARRWEIPPTGWRARRWIDVYRWAHREGTGGEVADFLRAQFVEYLELVGLSPYGGFCQEDFDGLARDGATARTLTKARLAGFWEFVFDCLSEREKQALGEPHSNNLMTGDRRTSRQTNWGEKVLNFTLELAAEPTPQLELNVVAWPKDVAAAFERWLRSAEGHQQLASLADYQVVLFSRRAALSQSGNPYWQHETYRHVRVVDAPAFNSEVLDGFRAGLEPRWELPAYHLRRAWPQAEVIARGEALAPDLAGEIRRLLPLVEAIRSL
jgi:hypothetical protein